VVRLESEVGGWVAPTRRKTSASGTTRRAARTDRT